MQDYLPTLQPRINAINWAQKHFTKALIALIFASLLSCSQQNPTLQREMIELDQAYIPTLLYSLQKDRAKSRQAIIQLQITWEKFKANHYRDLPDTSWRKALDQVGGLIARADGILNTGEETAAAAEALKEIPLILGQMRSNYDCRIFTDHLINFHKPIYELTSSLTILTEDSLSSSTLSKLKQLAASARYSWKTLDTLKLDTTLYQLGSAEHKDLTSKIDIQAAQLDSLEAALNSGDKQLIITHTLQINQLYTEIYTLFGKFDSQQ